MIAVGGILFKSLINELKDDATDINSSAFESDDEKKKKCASTQAYVEKKQSKKRKEEHEMEETKFKKIHGSTGVKVNLKQSKKGV